MHGSNFSAGCFSGWTAQGSWFSFFGSMFSDDSANTGDEEVEEKTYGS